MLAWTTLLSYTVLTLKRSISQLTKHSTANISFLFFETKELRQVGSSLLDQECRVKDDARGLPSECYVATNCEITNFLADNVQTVVVAAGAAG